MFLLEMQLNLARKTERHDLFEKIVRKSSANASSRLQRRRSLRIRLRRVISTAFDGFALPTGMTTTGISESN